MVESFVVCGVYSLCHTQPQRSGVAHLEFSVLRLLVETVAEDAGLSGTVSLWYERRSSDALRVPPAHRAGCVIQVSRFLCHAAQHSPGTWNGGRG